MPLYFLLDLALFVSEFSLALRRRSSAGTEKKDGNSLRLLWIVISVAITLAHFVAENGVGPALPRMAVWAGVAIFIAGAAFRWWSIVHLGRFFTVDVAVAADHRLVETGPYRWIRHPSYSGLLLQFLGIGLCLGNAVAVFIIIVPTWLALQHRITLEESALREKLGEVYNVYCERTGRLLPRFAKGNGPARI